MAIIAAISGVVLIILVLWEGFETIILPRRVTRRFRLTRFFYRSSWRPWVMMVNSLVPSRRQETWLSFFGPLVGKNHIFAADAEGNMFGS